MTHEINVAHLLASNFFGGPEKQLVEHGRRIADRHFAPHIFSFVERGQANQLLEKARQAGMATEEIPSRGPFDPAMIGNITALIRQNKIDLLCVHGYKANVIGRLASWRAGIPLIVISRGWTGEAAKVRCYEWLDKIFLRLADHVVAVSHGQRAKILALGVKPDKVSVIHNAINLAEVPPASEPFLRRQLGLPEDAIIVASAGRLSPEKNYAGMVAAAAQAAAQNDSVYFVIFGEGFLRSELEGKIAAAGLGGRFLLPGFRNDLQSVMQEIDIFMLPSFTEGLPNVVLEAFAARKPVVATRVGGTPEVVQDGVSGFLTTPDNVACMAESILMLAADTELRSAMGLAGNRYVAEHFGFEAQTRKYEELYGAVYNRRHAGS